MERADGFAYELSRQDGRAVVRLAGELDLATAPELAECLSQLRANGVPTVVVDLAELHFCDSTGLDVLVSFHRQTRDQGTRLVLRSPTPTVRRLLEVTRMDAFLEVVDVETPSGPDAARLDAAS